ncbi:hypothetical protein EEL30_15910 [Brevibacillus laterosporus]|uniref:Holin n=1 Tax=Brevibacillus laterosporus TaxID=1465 RepID=A0A518V9L5_BRELA|nr:hypothetical protein EEL30_15910 [Brevibacillus laterosporus]
MEFTYDIATLAAIVAALTGIAKGFGIPTKYAPLAAMAISGLFVFLPDGALKANLLTTVVVGLTAAGAYSYVKPDSNEGKSK